MCSSGLEEKKEAVQCGQKNSKKFPRGGSTIKENRQSLFRVLPVGCPGLGSQGRKMGSSLLGRGGALCSVILKPQNSSISGKLMV